MWRESAWLMKPPPYSTKKYFGNILLPDCRPVRKDIPFRRRDFFENGHPAKPSGAKLKSEAAAQRLNERFSPLKEGLCPFHLKLHQPGKVVIVFFADQILFRHMKTVEIFLGDVDPSLSKIDGDVLPEVGKLKGSADRVRVLEKRGIRITDDVKDNPADRIGGMAAVVEEVVEGPVPGGGDVHFKGGQKILKIGERDVEASDRLAERDKNRVGLFPFCQVNEMRLPFEQFLHPRAVILRLVGEIVGCSRKGVDATDVRPEFFRDESRGDGEVFVMVPGDFLAVFEGLFRHRGPFNRADGKRVKIFFWNPGNLD